MNEYIFRIPQDCPELTFEGLYAYLKGEWARTIGTTVTVEHCGHGKTDAETVAGGLIPVIYMYLYGTLIAEIGPDQVTFPVHRDGHMATTAWLSKIVRDNGIGDVVGRARRRKGDPDVPVPRGLAGPLAVDWNRDRLVEGHAYPVDHDRITRNRDFAERWAAEMAFRRAHPDQWTADLAAAKPGEGLPDYRATARS